MVAPQHRIDTLPSIELHPTPTTSSRIRLHVSVQECGGVGGDIVDVRNDTANVIGMTLVDVTGHGVEAAPHAQRVLDVLDHLDDADRNEPAWLARLNSRLNERLDDEHFGATISVRMQWSTDAEPVSISLANAGMPAPLIYRAETVRIERMSRMAPPLGALDEEDWLPQPTANTMAPGDLIILFSDGITEALAASGDRYGDERVEHVVRALASSGGRAVMDGLVEAVRRFADDRADYDDRTIVVIEAPHPLRNSGAIAAA